MTTHNKQEEPGDELQRFIESWIPINIKDAQHVKEAKIEARAEFIGLVNSHIQAILEEVLGEPISYGLMDLDEVSGSLDEAFEQGSEKTISMQRQKAAKYLPPSNTKNGEEV